MADDVKTCGGCSASIYPEHIDKGIAGYFGGKLLCPHCKKEQENYEPPDVDLSPVAVDAERSSSPGSTQIRSYSDDTLSGGVNLADESHYQHPPEPKARYAKRCRTFHAKLNEGAVGYMNEQINSWTDNNPDITIKFATSTIGVYEGKHNDPHLIITVFY